MANPIRIKRRTSGSPGAPSELLNAELAYNEVDDILYYGKGTGGEGGTATSVEAIGGKGAYVNLSGTQTITGAKTFSGAVNVPTPTNDSHAVTKAYADALLPNIEAGDDIVVTEDDGNLVISADATLARLVSPAFTGTPTVPTATAGTNNTQIASTAFVQAAIAALINSAPGALDTLGELAAALGDDADFAGSVTSALAGKQPLDATLTALAEIETEADVLIYATGEDTFDTTALTSFGRTILGGANAAAVRSSLSLGSIATQNANNVAITGGTIDGVTIDGGTF